MLKVNKKTPERRHSRRFGVSIVNFQHISHLFLMFLLLTLNKSMWAGNMLKRNAAATFSYFSYVKIQTQNYKLTYGS